MNSKWTPGLPERGDKVTRLEAFVDASFAFALTLLVVSGDSIPGSIAELTEALKQIPAYAASFIVIIQVWSSHAEWSRRFGLDEPVGNRLSLALVFIVLIFVYPLNMVFSGFFSMLTGGWLPANYTAHSWQEAMRMFQAFSAGFGAMALIMALLFWRALSLRELAGFTTLECAHAREGRNGWMRVLCISALSFAIAAWMPLDNSVGNWRSLPGLVFFLLPLWDLVARFRFQALLKRLERSAKSYSADGAQSAHGSAA